VISDVSEQEFQAKVVERSKQVPVVVDFWAEWCGPCRTLGPAIEDAVRKRNGEIELAKVDTDANQGIAREFGIQSIPAVKAFKDGKVVAEFVGAVPHAQIEAFLNEIVPSEADRLAESGDEEALRKALELDPRHAQAAIGLGRILLGRGEADTALETLKPFPHDFVADGLALSSRSQRTDRAPMSFRRASPPGTKAIPARRSSSCRRSWRASRTPAARISSVA
jgi:putative thioredoxin